MCLMFTHAHTRALAHADTHIFTFSCATGPEAKHYKGAVPQSELADLMRVQNAWGDRGTAVLLVCQNCGATHLCKDGDGERRMISGMEGTNKYDKAHNRFVLVRHRSRFGAGPAFTSQAMVSKICWIDELQWNKPLKCCWFKTCRASTEPQPEWRRKVLFTDAFKRLRLSLKNRSIKHKSLGWTALSGSQSRTGENQAAACMHSKYAAYCLHCQSQKIIHS